MTGNGWQDPIAERVWLLQVIVAALAGGCLVFMGVAVALDQLGRLPRFGQDAMLVTWIAVVFAFCAIGARMIVPAVIAASNRQAVIHGTGSLTSAGDPNVAEFLKQTGDAGRLWLGFLTKTILGAAILEGAAMFCLVAYLVEQSPLSLLVAIGLVVGLALHFPTRSSVVHWIQRELELVAQQRQFRT